MIQHTETVVFWKKHTLYYTMIFISIVDVTNSITHKVWLSVFDKSHVCVSIVLSIKSRS